MTNPTPTISDRALALEAGIVNELIKGMQTLLELQAATQPTSVPDLRAALHGAAELELQLRLGPHPYLRLVTLGADGGEDVLMRRIEMALPRPTN